MNYYIYTFNMLPLSAPGRGTEWNQCDVAAYISRWGRERFDYARKHQWVVYGE